MSRQGYISATLHDRFEPLRNFVCEGILLFVVCGLLPATVCGQAPLDIPVSAALKAQVVNAAADRIERYYVDPEKAKQIAVALRAALTSGPVAEARTALALVPAVNKTLSMSGDKHLRFGYSHEPDTRVEGAPETRAEHEKDLKEATQDWFGIYGVQRLEGNVGLLTWAAFQDPEFAGPAVVAAMQLLSSSDALIIDLRDSKGGSPDMVLLLLTYFVPEGDPVFVSSIENRFLGTTSQRWTLPYVPGHRYVDKPVYVLTSKRTWSAAEGFTESMRRVAHATVVGETTRGGEHLSRWMTVHPNFAVSVPVARHVAPADLKSWEGVGVPPDVPASESQALGTAHLLALRKLRERAKDPNSMKSLDDSIAAVEKK